MITKNIPKNIIKCIIDIFMDILKYKMFVQMADSNILRFTKAARNQEYPLRLFMKNRTETWIYNLNCLKPQCQSGIYQFDKN